ncbi:DUF4112 domain-containing protein [Haloarcula nitratireducens]|uniref:DUF4112 domain-containing protein n=1 Tax=Haloarcula nitratireducens TaxID=2487749 RepID=A0AAW4PGT8_9EURY|nr:DUF4112 domain-containing protein [Halomicroarcula nitratireducens]MBX0297128.1 DUF4112 domain-containing protein [Halomicroarcula nitratireducens]
MENESDVSETSSDDATDETNSEETTGQEIPVETESDGEDASGNVTVETDGNGQATAREEAALQRVETVSNLLDDAIPVPGTDFRIGLDPILSVVPVAGDIIAGAFSLYPLVEAARLDVPRNTLAKMLLLVAVDIAGGSVPVLGTVFDAFWKANVWNQKMIEDHVHGN